MPIAGVSEMAGCRCNRSSISPAEIFSSPRTIPAIDEQWLLLASNGNVIAERRPVDVKWSYDDGTSHVVRSTIELMGRLVALVPRPRVNLARFHGVFSRGGLPPRSKLREHVVPRKPTDESREVSPSATNKTYSKTGGQKLKRVFDVEIEKCEKCGGKAERSPLRSSPV